MKKILILGSTGMLGNSVTKAFLNSKENYNLSCTYRQSSKGVMQTNKNLFSDVDLIEFNVLNKDVEELFSENINPTYIINCIGIIKPFINNSRSDSIYVNSVFPHQLSERAEKCGVKVIHITTDCVFSGDKGNYSEEDGKDDSTLYGRSKALGEPASGCMVLRTSIIGPEIHKDASLIAWAVSQKGKEVSGYTNHMWNGITTYTYGKICEKIIKYNLYEDGVFHLHSPSKVSKFELLSMINNRYNLNLSISPVEANEKCERSLSSRFDLCRKLQIPEIKDQILEL